MGWMRATLHRFLSHWVVECPLFAVIFDIFVGQYRLGSLKYEIPEPLTTRAFRARWFLGRYEWFERSLIDRHLSTSAKVLELGGCLGVVSCYVNRKLDQPTFHKVFEANPALIPVLQRNKNLNQSSFLIEHAMISSHGQSTFFVADSVLDSSKYQKDGSGVQVPVKPISVVLSENQWADTLIMDIEGAEQDVFLSESADFSRIHLILLEMHERIIGIEAVRQISTRLSELGFEQADCAGQVEVWRRTRPRSAASHA